MLRKVLSIDTAKCSKEYEKTRRDISVYEGFDRFCERTFVMTKRCSMGAAFDRKI